jgi:hypothetical protein
MTGLKREIIKNLKRKSCNRKKDLTISGIAKTFGLSYPTAKRKIETGDFTVEQGLALMSIFFNEYSTDMLEYLFIDIGGENEKIYNKIDKNTQF